MKKQEMHRRHARAVERYKSVSVGALQRHALQLTEVTFASTSDTAQNWILPRVADCPTWSWAKWSKEKKLPRAYRSKTPVFTFQHAIALYWVICGAG